MICYDVRDVKRYRKLFKIVNGVGQAVQYSIFRCRLDDLETERLRWRLSQVLAPEDSLLIVDLCPSCARRVVSRNHVDGWVGEPAPFRIVGRPVQRGKPGERAEPRLKVSSTDVGAGDAIVNLAESGEDPESERE